MRSHVLVLTLLCGCPKPTPVAEEAEPEKVEPPAGTRAYMAGHYALAVEGREAVIVGNRDGWQSAGNQIAGYTRATVGLPEPWQDRLGELAFQGGELGTSETRHKAARAVAEMARTCGACHTENGPGPAFNFESAPLAASTVEERMLRHQWASERMWEGLVTPSPTLFETGARALTGAPMWGAETLPEDVAPLEGRIQAIGEQALAATKDSERVAAYGELLALCADCHAAAR
ncbi:MAG: hypothetical protein EP330_20465 [Deltaproteobacteria bacterium]|nr:MAG: hypothetical protein EP330_20465 [Deltaproteobacteria bacterium]